jgi:hypothetical protein
MSGRLGIKNQSVTGPPEIRVRPAILAILLDELARSNQPILPSAYCLLLSSASICIHQPQRSITRHAKEFGTLIIENRRIAGLTPGRSRQPCFGDASA